MNKQELIKNIRNIDVVESFMSETIWVKRNDVLALVYQLDEPEKPVVPQFVADWYESIKDDFEYNLYKLCTDFREQKLRADLNGWFSNDNNKPIETLVLMHKFGYEVEKEKLYTVEIPNPHGLGHSILVKDMYGNIFITHVMNSDWRKSKVNQLTEAEIKKDFEWAWQFAKEDEE